jgi:hypothetical protein
MKSQQVETGFITVILRLLEGGTKITSRLVLVPVNGRQRTDRINGELLEASEAISYTN